MAITLAELAVRYGCELHGDPDQLIERVGTLQAAGAGCISFLSNPGYKKYLEHTSASAVILAAEAAVDCKVACLVAEDPYAVYARVAADLHPARVLLPGVHAGAVVDASATVPVSCEVAAGAVIGANAVLGEHVFVGANTVIGADVSIGMDTRIMPNVSVYHDVRIGERCIIHSGAVIGADGFGIAQTPDGWLKVPQVGGVTIGNDVEVGANTAIDRGAIDDTRLDNGVKLDNLVQIAHNVHLGEHTAIAGQSGVAGSSKIGARCVIGGGVSVSGHLTLVDDVYLLGRSSVSKSIDKPGVYSSVFGVEEASKWRKLVARFKRLDDMAVKLRALERKQKSDSG